MEWPQAEVQCLSHVRRDRELHKATVFDTTIGDRYAFRQIIPTPLLVLLLLGMELFIPSSVISIGDKGVMVTAVCRIMLARIK